MYWVVSLPGGGGVRLCLVLARNTNPFKRSLAIMGRNKVEKLGKEVRGHQCLPEMSQGQSHPGVGYS